MLLSPLSASERDTHVQPHEWCFLKWGTMRRSAVRIPAETRAFCFSKTVQTGAGAQPHIPPIRRPDPWVDNSSPSSAEVKNKWSYIFAPAMRLHSADRGNFWLFLVSEAPCREGVWGSECTAEGPQGHPPLPTEQDKRYVAGGFGAGLGRDTKPCP
jgi:hypothetical protein